MRTQAAGVNGADGACCHETWMCGNRECSGSHATGSRCRGPRETGRGPDSQSARTTHPRPAARAIAIVRSQAPTAGSASIASPSGCSPFRWCGGDPPKQSDTCSPYAATSAKTSRRIRASQRSPGNPGRGTSHARSLRGATDNPWADTLMGSAPTKLHDGSNSHADPASPGRSGPASPRSRREAGGAAARAPRGASSVPARRTGRLRCGGAA